MKFDYKAPQKKVGLLQRVNLSRLALGCLAFICLCSAITLHNKKSSVASSAVNIPISVNSQMTADTATTVFTNTSNVSNAVSAKVAAVSVNAATDAATDTVSANATTKTTTTTTANTSSDAISNTALNTTSNGTSSKEPYPLLPVIVLGNATNDNASKKTMQTIMTLAEAKKDKAKLNKALDKSLDKSLNTSNSAGDADSLNTAQNTAMNTADAVNTADNESNVDDASTADMTNVTDVTDNTINNKAGQNLAAASATITIRKGDSLTKIFKRQGYSQKNLETLLSSDPKASKKFKALQLKQTLKVYQNENHQVVALALDDPKFKKGSVQLGRIPKLIAKKEQNAEQNVAKNLAATAATTANLASTAKDLEKAGSKNASSANTLSAKASSAKASSTNVAVSSANISSAKTTSTLDLLTPDNQDAQDNQDKQTKLPTLAKASALLDTLLEDGSNKVKASITQGKQISKSEEAALNAAKLEIKAADLQNASASGSNTSSNAQKQAEKQVAFSKGTVKDSLYSAGKRAGLDKQVINQLVEIFGWSIDFSLIQPTDRFRVLYEEKRVDGEKVGNGSILAAEMTFKGKVHRAIRYTDKSGQTNYFSPEGSGLKETFLRYPVAFSHVSSEFGLRRHPIRHKMREHKGVDFAAARGTPVNCTGDGQVTFVGTKRGYGKVIEVQHGDQYSTLYAHLSKFSPKLKAGMKVKKGQVIGNVGRTGLATGNHLHYEFRVAGVHRDPLKIALPKKNSIANPHKKPFLAHAKEMIKLMDQQENKVNMVRNESPEMSNL